MATDVRFNKIAVSIFDTHPLGWYFTRSERMQRATLYCDVYNEWQSVGTRDIFRTAEFLETLYYNEPNKLVNLLSYIIGDLVKYIDKLYRGVEYYSEAHKTSILMNECKWFFYELETIGITCDKGKFYLAVGTTDQDIRIKSRLESMLSELDTAYLSRYQGAIEALTSNNPDSLSQSISSMRELLTAILHSLTEGDTFTEDELTDKSQPKRKARIRHILAKSEGLGAEAELAEATANMLDKTYRALSKGFHVTAKKDWDNILYVFKSTEYLIYYVLLHK